MRTTLLFAILLLIGCTPKPADDSGIDNVDADADGYTSLQDCDDDIVVIDPAATETCNGVDDDCDGLIDDDDPSLEGRLELSADADGDGWGSMDPLDNDAFCEHPGDGWSDDPTDCDDTDPDVSPGAQEYCNFVDDDCDGEVDEAGALDSTWYVDQDGDGYGTDDATLVQCEQPSGYVLEDTDCNDADADVHPGADEYCNDRDDDCDSGVDEDAVDESTWYRDVDNDGYGDDDDTVMACTPPAMYTGQSGDCDDDDATVNPDSNELCNEVDDDCDGSIDESATDARTWYADNDGDGYGDPDMSSTSCDQPTGWVGNDNDCDDGDATVHPGAEEYCDDVDDDCDGGVDEAAVDQGTWYADSDGDGYGDASRTTTACDQPSGTSADDTDCDDGDSSIHPGAAEYCDGDDDDCDGTTDESPVDGTTWYPDNDGDGYGDDSSATVSCTRPANHSSTGGDCDDSDATISPAATELCDGVDNDCDGTDDDANAATLVKSTGATVDYTSIMGAGSSTSAATVAISTDGTLTLCDGTYYVHLQAKTSDLSVVGLNGSGSTSIVVHGTDSVIEAFGSCSTLTLRGVTVSGGSATDGGGIDAGNHGVALELDDVVVQNSSASSDGGGIYLSSGTIAATDLVLSSNRAGSQGGGMYVYAATVELDTVTVEDNTSTYSGGGLFLDVVTLTFDSVSVGGNVSGSYGGGAYIRYAHAEIDSSEFSGNTADYGGGVMFYSSYAYLWDSSVDDNEATGGPGGGVYASNGEVVLDSGWIEGNTATTGTSFWGVGGGVFLNNASSFACYGSSSATEGVYDNDADTYGGGAILYDDGSTLYSDTCDWGSGSSDNSPDDVTVVEAAIAYVGLGGDETFICDSTGCW